MGQVIVLGLIGGGIYALFALGVVMVYRGTGVLSFAQGEIGTASLFLAAFLVDHGLRWWVGALAALVFGTALGVLFEFAVVRRMIGTDPVSVAVATVGFLLLLTTGEILYAGPKLSELPGPFADNTMTIAGVVVTPVQIAALVLAVALGLGLQSLLRRTDFGLGILAAAQDPVAVRLVGVPLSRVSATVWGVGAALSVVAALLVEPTVGVFTAGYASQLYLVGLAAAVIGGLTSLPGAVVGGLALGLLESAATRYLGSSGLPGLRYVVVLVALLVVLLGRQLLPVLKARLVAQRPAAALEQVPA